MKKISAMFLALCSTMMLYAAPDDAQVYRAATRHIDFDGDSIIYYNSTELFSMLNSLPETGGKIAAAFIDPVGHDRIKLVSDAAKILVEALNLDALRAIAWSHKELRSDLHIYKSSCYLGKEAQLPGIFNISGINGNISLQDVLAALPSDLIFAAKMQIMPGKFYGNLMETIQKSDHPQIKNFCNMFIQGVPVDVAKLLNSANGLYTLIIAGETPETFRVSLTIPDRDGTISAELKKVLPPSPQSPGRTVLPCPIGKGQDILRPEIVYLDKEIMLVSNGARCLETPHRPYALKADFLRLLPASGAGFTFVNLTPKAIASLKSAVAPQIPALTGLFNTLTPANLAEVTRVSPNGIYSIAVADFSIESVYFDFCMKLGEIINQMQSAKNVKTQSGK